MEDSQASGAFEFGSWNAECGKTAMANQFD